MNPGHPDPTVHYDTYIPFQMTTDGYLIVTPKDAEDVKAIVKALNLAGVEVRTTVILPRLTDTHEEASE